MATMKAGRDWQLATSNTTFSVQCVSVQELEIKRMATETTPANTDSGNKLRDTQVANQDNLGGSGDFIYVRSYGGSNLTALFQVD